MAEDRPLTNEAQDAALSEDAALAKKEATLLRENRSITLNTDVGRGRKQYEYPQAITNIISEIDFSGMHKCREAGEGGGVVAMDTLITSNHNTRWQQLGIPTKTVTVLLETSPYNCFFF